MNDTSFEDYTDDYSSSELLLEDEPCELKSNHEVIVQTYIYCLICVLGLVGNVLVLVTFAFYKKPKTMTDIYLVNVALADLLFVVALPLIIYNEHHDWIMGAWACKVLRGTYNINLYSSTLLLACVSGDRYIAIVLAGRSLQIRTRVGLYSRLICSLVWLLAVVLSLPLFIYIDQGSDDNQCVLHFQRDDTAKLMKILVPSMQMVMGFLLPLLVMIFCYSCIIATLLKAKNFRKHRAVRVVLIVVLVFVVCHLPYNIALLVHTSKLFRQRSCQQEQQTLVVLSVSRSLAYLHCCLNPLLYAFIGEKFRTHFRQILRDLWCLGKRYINPRSSSQQTSELNVSANHRAADVNLQNPSSFSM